MNISRISFYIFFCMAFSFAQQKSSDTIKKLEASIEVSEEKLQELVKTDIQNNQAKFIVFGISDLLTKEHLQFTEKYGIGFYRETCAVYPALEQKAKITNTLIATQLHSKFGDAWMTDLPEAPFGISILSER